MNNIDKTKLASLLLELDLHEIRDEEKTATWNRDFEKLQNIAGLRGSIDMILEYLEK